MAPLPSNPPMPTSKLNSDKNQIDETSLVNAVTSSSVPAPALPVSLATTISVDPPNPQLTPLEPVQCAMCEQMIYSSSWLSQLWRHLPVILLGINSSFVEVIALKKSSTSLSRGQRQSKNKDNKTKRKRAQESSSKDEKPV